MSERPETDVDEAGAVPPVRWRLPVPNVRSVGRRLALAFGVVLALLVAIVVWSVVALGSLRASATRINAVDVPLAAAANDLQTEVGGMLQGQVGYVLYDGSGRASFEAKLERVDAAMDRLAHMVHTPTQLSLVAKMRSEFGAFREVDTHVWNALQQGRAEAARSLIAGPNALTVSFLEADAGSLADQARAAQDTALAGIDHTLGTARVALLTLGLFAVAAGTAMATRSARRIRRPLAELERAAHQAAAGDLAVTVEAHSDDEIGRLVSAFNTMVAALRRAVTDATFDTQLRAAFEMVDTEADVIDVLGEAVYEVVPGAATEFLLADSSKAHMRQSTVRGPLSRGPSCPVESPFGCAAVRSGQTMIFTSSGELGTCPHLRTRPYGMVSAACVPVTFMGRALGVIHTIGPAGTPPAEADVERLRVLATQAGSRIGMVRAFDRTQLQASTDALTGLMNRRSVESRIHELESKGTGYSLIMFDLDRFKQLNDTYGHETGDRALRRFAGALRDSIRPKDVAARFGGEEFVVLLPTCGAGMAVAVAERVRAKLLDSTTTADLPMFTVSAGVASTAHQGAFEATMRAADAALYLAKANGRDQVCVAEGEDLSAEEAVTPAQLAGVTDLDGGMFSQMNEPDPVFDRM